MYKKSTPNDKMQLDLHDANHATRVLGQATTMDALTHQPTFVVVKAHWCPHCVALEDPMKDLQSSMRKSGVHFLTMELDAYERAAAAAEQHRTSRPSIMAALSKNGAAKNGVPYLALVLPEGPDLQVTPYNGSRDSLAMAKFILSTLKSTSGTKSRRRS